MHLKPAVCLILTAALLQSCAHNPARALSPNAEEVKVLEPDSSDKKKVPTGFVRGEDPLDEQEFYSVIGDTASTTVVRSSRSMGSLLQSAGLAMLVTGVLAAASGLAMYALSNNTFDGVTGSSTRILTLPEKLEWLPLGVGVAGGVLAGLGGTLFVSSKSKARGDAMIFDFAHAQGSLEKSLYGDEGASADFIKQVSFSTEDGEARLCSAGETRLTALEATDEKGRKMRIADRADWFTWSTTPEVELRDLPMLEGKPVGKAVASPLNSSLAQLDSVVSIVASVKGSGVKSELLLKNDLGCPGRTLDFGGAWGGWGEPGTAGRTSSNAADGGDGQDGGAGSAGGRGPSLKVEAAWVTSASRGRMLLVAVGDRLALVDPTRAGKIVIEANGGRGGKGGSGGRGGTGGSAKSQSCMPGGDGGRGGRGGSGGAGGAGGHITLKLADRSIADFLSVRAKGGEGGAEGSGGSGGGYGSRGTCKKGFAKEGNSGQRGPSGAAGPSGPDGSVDTTVVGAGELRLISAALSTNPTVALEAQTRRPTARR